MMHLISCSTHHIKWIAAVVLLAVPFAAHGQHAAEEPGVPPTDSFKPVLYERDRTIHLNGDPDEVFGLFKPDGFQKWSKRKTPPQREVLFEGQGDSWSTYMSRVFSAHSTRWNVVAEHDRDDKLIRYVLLIPDVELLVHEIQCLPKPGGGTIAIVSWKCAGLSDDGNSQVSQFFDGGHFERQIDGWEQSINEYLGAASESSGH